MLVTGLETNREGKGSQCVAQSPQWRKMREASPTLTTTMDVLTQLKSFRQAAYDCLGKADDATFELTDAVLLRRNAYCLAVQGATTKLKRLLYKYYSSQTFAIKCLLIANGIDELLNPYLTFMESNYPVLSI